METKLTEKEAWIRIAEQFDAPRVYGSSGLCRAVNILVNENRISEDTYDSMDATLDSHRYANMDAYDKLGYLIPSYVEPEGRKLRANLARKFADECQ